MNLDDTLRDRIASNGEPESTAELAQAFKFAMRRGRNWESLSMASKEALEQIASYQAMILNGDASDASHWNHVAEYARICGKALESINRGLESNVSRLARLRARDLVPPLSGDDNESA